MRAGRKPQGVCEVQIGSCSAALILDRSCLDLGVRAAPKTDISYVSDVMSCCPEGEGCRAGEGLIDEETGYPSPSANPHCLLARQPCRISERGVNLFLRQVVLRADLLLADTLGELTEHQGHRQSRASDHRFSECNSCIYRDSGGTISAVIDLASCTQCTPHRLALGLRPLLRPPTRGRLPPRGPAPCALKTWSASRRLSIAPSLPERYPGAPSQVRSPLVLATASSILARPKLGLGLPALVVADRVDTSKLCLGARTGTIRRISPRWLSDPIARARRNRRHGMP